MNKREAETLANRLSAESLGDYQSCGYPDARVFRFDDDDEDDQMCLTINDGLEDGPGATFETIKTNKGTWLVGCNFVRSSTRYVHISADEYFIWE